MRCVIASAALLAFGSPVVAQTFAITNARIHTVAGPAIERGTIVFRDGRITDVGANVTAPAGARVIDAAGKVVTPGLLDSHTSLGLVEIPLSAGPSDASTTSPRLTAAYDVVDAIDPASTLFPVNRVEGITRAVVAPATGSSIIAGRGAVIDLGGERVDEMLARSPSALYVTLGQAGAALAGGSREAAILLLKEALADARDFAANRAAWQDNRRREYALGRLDMEALVPVVRGEVVLAVNVHRASDILSVLRLREAFPELRLVLTGATEAWVVATDLVAAQVPVVIDPLQNLPGMENSSITLENAARLHDAGATVAFATFESHNARNLKQRAGNAIAYGMPQDAALRAVTAVPAQIWGIADRYGTLEVGKDADIVVWSGDPFELSTAAEHVFIKGRQMPDMTRQKLLLEKYRSLR
jgi:imidazolonepropionase-like amidohydrolase